jgi:hypothetical protein
MSNIVTVCVLQKVLTYNGLEREQESCGFKVHAPDIVTHVHDIIISGSSLFPTAVSYALRCDRVCGTESHDAANKFTANCLSPLFCVLPFCPSLFLVVSIPSVKPFEQAKGMQQLPGPPLPPPSSAMLHSRASPCQPSLQGTPVQQASEMSPLSIFATTPLRPHSASGSLPRHSPVTVPVFPAVVKSSAPTPAPMRGRRVHGLEGQNTEAGGSVFVPMNESMAPQYHDNEFG